MASATLNLNLQALVASALDLETPQSTLNLNSLYSLTDGSGDQKYQQLYSDTRTTDGTGESLDLVGSLKNAFGQTISFTKIKVILIRAASTNTLSVHVGGAATNQFVAPFGAVTDLVKILPGGLILFVASNATGYACAAGSTDLLKVVASTTGSVTYDIVILGEGTAA